MSRKRLYLTLISLIMGSGVYAQNSESQTDIQPECNYVNTIQGPTDIASQIEKMFDATIEGAGGVSIDTDLRSSKSTFRIIYDGNEVATFENVSQFTYSFSQPGIYTITHEAIYQGCTITTSTNITTYTHTIAAIGSTTLSEDIIRNLKQRDILMHIIPAQTESLIAKSDTIRDSSLILLDSTDIAAPTQKLLSTTYGNILSDQDPTPVLVISDAQPSLTKKIIGSIVHDTPHPTYIIDSETFSKLLLLWRIGDRDEAKSIIVGSLQANTNDNDFGFNGFIDSLLFQGIPLAILASMITLVVLTVFLIFLRQVVGLNVFSIYYPLLGAITLPLIGKKLFLIFFVIAGLSHRLLYLVSRKLDILVHAKIGIYLTFYSILSITALRAISMSTRNIDRNYIQSIGTRATLGGFFAIAIIGQKVYQNKKNIRKHITNIITYLILIIPLSRLLTSITVQYWMITHTYIVFIAIIMALILGRFTGMKLLEYKRFWKLLRKSVGTK